ncbi:MAG: methyltransferase [Proteobacteria bacterium]|nr:methyltransferase [Pseudomonadota bacterium]MBT6192103.1 methyltransferase [Pseudomonadota bacterium]MBT6464432.1 methyltransferase [Pseudomonadota bacterium]MBT6674550.1 methyltransferase [Pseudomonadota bacterium]MBT7247323.1 methyltransferase [Pseudomonadota bacterium]
MVLNSTTIEGDIAYIDSVNQTAEHLVYPVSSGKKIVRPANSYQKMIINDGRREIDSFSVDLQGFSLIKHQSSVADFYDNEVVKRQYYPEMIELLKTRLNATDVLIFDHNQRSKVRAAAMQPEVRNPVASAHVDYTLSSAPNRSIEILEKANKSHYVGRRLALINAWRPIIGPAEDFPLALCDMRTVQSNDLVQTDIHHFSESDPETPRHSGQIYSLRHNFSHKWHYFSAMEPDEVLLLRNWDSTGDKKSDYTPHTGFKNDLAPEGTRPRESIEIRTLVVY